MRYRPVSLLKRFFTHVARDVTLNLLIASPLLPRPLRPRLMRLTGMRVGRCKVAPGGWYGNTDISIGDESFLNYSVKLDSSDAEIHIGRDVNIGMGASLITGTHLPGPSSRRAGPPTGRPIYVGDGAWLGANVLILPGVRIGEGCLIAAGSVVTRDCERDTLYAGVPARAVRRLSREHTDAQS